MNGLVKYRRREWLSRNARVCVGGQLFLLKHPCAREASLIIIVFGAI